MIISHKHKLIFIHVPKTGGTTIISSLYHKLGPRFNGLLSPIHGVMIGEPIGPLHQHSSVSQLFKHCNYDGFIADIFAEYDSFSVVRNPFDVLVSYYHFFKQSDALYVQSPDIAIRARKLGFKEWLMTMDDTMMESRTQTSYVALNGVLLIKKIFKYENYNEVLAYLDRFGINKVSMRANSSEHNHYSEYYDSESCAFVLQKYADDFTNFGYSLGHP